MLRQNLDSVSDVVYRVLNGEGGSPVGTAFLVHKQMLLTCTHVVALAQGAGIYDKVNENIPVWVDLRSSPGKSFKVEIAKATPTDKDYAERDIAFLRLPESEYSSPLSWSTSPPENGCIVEAFGYQPDFRDGGRPKGTLLGPDSFGWRQIDGYSLSGVPFIGGLSGSPVWDDATKQVIGMLALAHSSEILKVAFVIPFESINKVCPNDFYLVVHPPRFEDLENALLRLDYKPQLRSFVEKFTKSPNCPTAFVIHGESGFGQQIVMRKLLKSVGMEKAHLLRVSFGAVKAPSLDALYSELLAYQILPPKRFPVKFSASFLIKKLRLEDTIICVQIGISVDSKAISELIDNFWIPLAKAVQEANPVKRLLLLIIDEGGSRSHWDFSTCSTKNSDPLFPVELPSLQKFDTDLISDFIQEELCPLNASLILRVESICRQILSESDDGRPEPVFQALCEPFGVNWDNEMARVIL